MRDLISYRSHDSRKVKIIALPETVQPAKILPKAGAYVVENLFSGIRVKFIKHSYVCILIIETHEIQRHTGNIER